MTTPVPIASVGPLSRALVEALDSVAARDQVRTIVRGALLSARLEVVPEDAEVFGRFVSGALRGQIERSLGAGTADLVLEQLDHMVRMIAPARRATGTSDDADELSGERIVEAPPTLRASEGMMTPKSRVRPDIAAWVPSPSAIQAPDVSLPRATSFESGTQPKRTLARVSRQMPATQGQRPSYEEINAPSSGSRTLATDVIVISLDPRVVNDVETRLRGRSRVRGVITTDQLTAALAAVEGGRIAIVLDTGVPSIDVPTFASIALPPGTHVVLWGTDERHKARLVAVFPQAAKWSASNACASPADVLLAEA